MGDSRRWRAGHVIVAPVLGFPDHARPLSARKVGQVAEYAPHIAQHIPAQAVAVRAAAVRAAGVVWLRMHAVALCVVVRMHVVALCHVLQGQSPSEARDVGAGFCARVGVNVQPGVEVWEPLCDEKPREAARPSQVLILDFVRDGADGPVVRLGRETEERLEKVGFGGALHQVDERHGAR